MTIRLVLAASLVVAQPTPMASVPIGAGVVAIVLPFENPQAISRLHWMREGVALLLGDRIAASGLTQDAFGAHGVGRFGGFAAVSYTHLRATRPY